MAGRDSPVDRPRGRLSDLKQPTAQKRPMNFGALAFAFVLCVAAFAVALDVQINKWLLGGLLFVASAMACNIGVGDHE